MELILSKIIAVNEKSTLPEKYMNNYFPEIDMYLFFSEATYDTTTGSYSGCKKLHDRIASEYNLPHISNDNINYLSVDIKPTDKTHTYLTSNKRFYQLSENQKSFISKLFSVNYF